jgi:hypothetical protein
VVYQSDNRYNNGYKRLSWIFQYGRDMDVYGSYAMTADNYHEER